MDVSYKNTCYRADGYGYGPPIYEPERFVKHCEGYDIYYRAACFDIVKDGACVMQMAGINGATDWCRTQLLLDKE